MIMIPLLPSGLPRTRLSVMSFSIALAFSTAAVAQQAPSSPIPSSATEVDTGAGKGVKKNSEQSMQKVEVQGARAYDERRQDTATKIVVTQEDIVRYGDTTIGDVLKRLPGVTIGGVQGRGGEIRMRGLGSGYTQILLNGEPSPPGFSLDSIAPELIERIEIIRAATAELSTQAIAGAINIVLKKTVQTAQREIKVGGQEDGGKFGENLNFQVSDKAGSMSYSISGNANHGQYERPSSFEEYGTDANGTPNLLRHTEQLGWGTFNGIGFSPRINWSFENGDTLTTQSFVNANRFDGYSSENAQTYLGVLPTYISDLQKIRSDFEMVRSNLNWIHKLADSAKLDVKFGVNYNKRSSDVDLLGYWFNQAQILKRTNNSSGSDKGFTTSGKYSAPFVENHAFVFGWDAGYSQRNTTQIQQDIVSNIVDAQGKSQTNLSPINLNEVFSADVSRLALFAQDEWSVNKQLSVYAGLRWEALDTRSSGNSYADVHNKSSVWSPILQTLWKLPDSKNDQVRFGLTRTYKAPDTGQLIPRRFISNNNGPTSPDSMGNPNLKPELAWGLDAAFEHYLPGGGMLSASIYMRKIDDIIRTNISQQLIGAETLWVAMPVNDGQATTKGIELEAKFPLRSLMATAPAIDFRANVSFNWSDLKTVPGPNNRLDSQTPISANLGLDYKLDTIPLTIGGNFSFQDGGLVRTSATQTKYSIPKRVLDLYGLWKFDPKTNFRLSLSNALHQENISASSYFDPVYGGITQTNITPTTVAVRALFEHKF